MGDFIVSARKYRPATFESVVGQKHITSTLRNAISRGQLAHAYLFCGPRGVGKTTCARIFAKSINCLSPGQNAEPCETCESCRSFVEGRSFNIHELDAASNNSVDDIRSLIEQVRIPPQIGRYSVYIIDEVHMLTSAAFNAFLKTLEEPPAHAVFILATTEKHRVIPTILSRCQIYDFNRIRPEDGVEYMRHIASKEGVTTDDESLYLIAAKADGGMRDALSMFDKAVSFCGMDLKYHDVASTLNILDYDTYFSVVEHLKNGDYQSVLKIFDEVLGKGFSPQVFVGGLNSHMRDLLMTRDRRTIDLLQVSGTLRDKYVAQGQDTDTQFLFRAMESLTTLDGTLKSAANQRLNVEVCLVKLAGAAEKKKPNGSLTGDNKQSEQVVPPANTASTASTSVKSDPPREKHPVQAPAPLDNVVHQASVTENAVSTPEKKTESPIQDKPASSQTTEPPVHKAAPIRSTPKNGTTISGTSINDLMGKSRGIYDDIGQETNGPKAPVSIDPEAGNKLKAAMEKFAAHLDAHRPRIAMAFRKVKLSGHKLALSVPTEVLREEILRNKTEILTDLAGISGVDGLIELEVTVDPDAGPKRPVKAEDRLKYLTLKNPALTELKKKLDLELE